MAQVLSFIRLFFKYFPYIFRMSISHLRRSRQFQAHAKTYHTLPAAETKTILVIGGSFSGFHLTHLLSHSLPTGYRVVLVEKNSHFNFTFNFPRYSVLDNGNEGKAFIPFDGYLSEAPEGIYERIRGEVKTLREREVELLSGQIIPFEYLVIATGATQSPPAKLLSSTKKGACEELKALQRRIGESENIALVGGGAVGIQLACDIKTFLPGKKVTLIHSRDQLLPNFGVKLHNYVLEKLKALGVVVVLGERPVLPKVENWAPASLTFKDGRVENFDVVVPCTGQTPNSSLLQAFAPESISHETHRILVKPNLQIDSNLKATSDHQSDHQKTDDNSIDKIYAIGDVAEANAPKMARAGMMQAEIVWNNILAQIESEGGSSNKKSRQFKNYVPVLGMEGILKLGLGKDDNVTYIPDEGNGGYLFPGKSKSVDLDADGAWKYFKADASTFAILDG